jgi:hypothetical protein
MLSMYARAFTVPFFFSLHVVPSRCHFSFVCFALGTILWWGDFSLRRFLTMPNSPIVFVVHFFHVPIFGTLYVLAGQAAHPM